MPGKHKNRKSFRDPSITKRTCLSAVQRAEILALFHHAGWNKTQIARKLQIARTTVVDTIKRGNVTPTKPIGRPLLLTTSKRNRLISRATTDANHRRYPYEFIARLEGIDACKRTLKAAFEKELFHRRKAIPKPLLTEAHRKARLAWAQQHATWDFEMWKRVAWTDEAMCRLGGFGHVWITRTAQEKYDISCCVPKFQSQAGLMIWGAISGCGKSPLWIYESGEKINAITYSHKILPLAHSFMREIERNVGLMRGILMEDGASSHTAKYTASWHNYYGFNKMNWPANSPDLNPIENVWRLLKYRIARRIPHGLDELRRVIFEEWEKLTLDDYLKYIESMPQRVQAVIDANGGPTKY